MLAPKTLAQIARALAAWCAVFLVVFAGRPSFTNASLPVRGVSDPVVALESARTPDEIELILGEAPSADREVMRIKMYVDFAVLGGYLALALVIAAVLERSGRRRLAPLLTLLAILAGAQNFRGNLQTLRIVNLHLNEITPALLNALRFTSITKWSSLAKYNNVCGSKTTSE